MSHERATAQDRRVMMDGFRTQIENRLQSLVPEGAGPSVAARHSLLAPAKRLRAVLTMAAAEEAGGDPMAALDTACAVEMIHSASLVFDDLPAMDDAATRRGIATAHVLYGDDVAILAGIGLLNGAYAVVAADTCLGAEQRLSVIRQLTTNVGWDGLVHGQALDLKSDIQDDASASLDDIHYGKTGALFVAAAVAGAICADAPEPIQIAMAEYGRALGFAYQAFDDLLDQLADDSVAGKPTGADGQKVTAMKSVIGHERDTAIAHGRAREHLTRAKTIAADIVAPSILADLADQIADHFDKAFGSADDAA